MQTQIDTQQHSHVGQIVISVKIAAINCMHHQTMTRLAFWLSGQTSIGFSWVFFGPQGPVGTA